MSRFKKEQSHSKGFVAHQEATEWVSRFANSIKLQAHIRKGRNTYNKTEEKSSKFIVTKLNH